MRFRQRYAILHIPQCHQWRHGGHALCAKSSHAPPRADRLRKNQDLLRSLRSQHGARLRLRAERGPSPQELVKQASLAARLQDLDIIRLEAGIERREPAQWDELRVWDPGDG